MTRNAPTSPRVRGEVKPHAFAPSFQHWSMSDFLQLLVSGLATGAIYALIAIGFTLLWQTSQTINFAQGEFVMLPAFFVLTGMGYFHQPFWVAIVAALVVS